VATFDDEKVIWNLLVENQFAKINKQVIPYLELLVFK
jgi:hypothetical protein